MINTIIRTTIVISTAASLLAACSVQNQIGRQARHLLLKDSAISKGHIGICIYDAGSGQYLYNHNADKYFTPASNAKLFTWYAGMKFLGDSIAGIRYMETADSIFLQGSGDPTLLHPDFVHQPVLNFLKQNEKPIAFSINSNDHFEPLGNGWAWNDFESDYMAERSVLPIYGNVASFTLQNGQLRSVPGHFAEKMYMVVPADEKFFLHRQQHDNQFSFNRGNSKFTGQQIPFVTGCSTVAMKELLALSGKDSSVLNMSPKNLPGCKTIYSQPADSLFKLMMHRSDNFFAEQTLLMVSNELLGFMSDEHVIDSLQRSVLKDIPQRPIWVDGSGLSRYNLFTPQDFVWLLRKARNEFEWERITNILPTGGEGTLKYYYPPEAGFIYAKTGTLSNNCALSGYLITRKNRLLIFSVLANNYPTAAAPVRRAVEKFIKKLRKEY